MKKLKPLFTFLLVLAVLVVAYYASVYLANRAKQHAAPETNEQINGNLNSNNEVSTTEQASLKTYTNALYKFSLQYPGNFKTGTEDFIYLPYGNTQIKTEANFYHEIDEDHCALSGKCEDTTHDLDFGISIVPTSLQDIENKLSPQKVVVTKHANISTYTICQGIEGEGMCYAFIPMNSKATLVIYNNYIDEAVVGNYKNAAGFITYEKQQEIMNQIFNSIKFTK